MTTKEYISTNEYTETLCYAVEMCRHDKDLDRIRKQLDQTKAELACSVKAFKVAEQKVKAAIVEREHDFMEHDLLNVARLTELNAGRTPWLVPNIGG